MSEVDECFGGTKTGEDRPLTTKGFRDALELRRGNRDELWDFHHDVAASPVRRRDRLEVKERIDYTGQILFEATQKERAISVPTAGNGCRRIPKKCVPWSQRARLRYSIRRYGVILDRKTMEVLTRTAEEFRQAYWAGVAAYW